MRRIPLVLAAVVIVFAAISRLDPGGRGPLPPEARTPGAATSRHDHTQTRSTDAAPDRAATLIALLVDEAAAPPTTVAATPSIEPLPAWDARLVDVLPTLRARADRGDVAAACHLALALSACAFTRARQASPALMRVLKPDDKDAIDDVARSNVDYLRNGREATCVDVAENEFESRFHYLRAAAEGGSEAAMLAFVEGMPLLSFDAMVRHVDWVEQYRLDAPRYVAQLLRRGSRRAAVLFAIEGNGFRATLLSQLLQLDARSAATLHQLGRRVRGEPYTVNHLSFTAEQEAVGRGRAEVIFARYFGSRGASAKELRNALDLFDVEACAEGP